MNKEIRTAADANLFAAIANQALQDLGLVSRFFITEQHGGWGPTVGVNVTSTASYGQFEITLGQSSLSCAGLADLAERVAIKEIEVRCPGYCRTAEAAIAMGQKRAYAKSLIAARLGLNLDEGELEAAA